MGLPKDVFDRVRARRTQLGLAIRVTVAATAAYAIATALHLLLPLWAVLTSLIVTQLSVGRSLKATRDYVLGTIGGAPAPARNASAAERRKRTIAALTSASGAASRICTSAGNGTTVERPIITTSWRSRKIVRSRGPVSGPPDSRAERSRSASAPMVFMPTVAVPIPS